MNARGVGVLCKCVCAVLNRLCLVVYGNAMFHASSRWAAIAVKTLHQLWVNLSMMAIWCDDGNDDLCVWLLMSTRRAYDI